MRNRRLATLVCSFLLALVPVASEAVLEVTLDSGAGTMVFTDDDADGDVDFDTTVSGIFEAKGTAKEEFTALAGKLALAPLSPNPLGIFRNISGVQQTFTVTVKSTALASALAAPLGWQAFYTATANDFTDSSLNILSHSVTAKGNSGALSLGSASGAAIIGGTGVGISQSAQGSDAVNSTTDVVMVWTMSLGANDEIDVPSDNGFDADSIQVNIFNQTQKCIDKMNNGAKKVGDTAQKIDAKCTKDAGDQTACVDNTADEKTDKKVQKVVDDFAAFCDPVPTWGVNSDSCCVGGSQDGFPCAVPADCTAGACTAGGCIPAAADFAANDVTHDLWGATVTVSADKATSKCQEALTKALGKTYAQRWKSFRKCKKDNFALITDDASLASTCLSPTQPDADGKIGKAETKLTDAAQKKCVDKGVTGLGTLFPGECAAVPDPGFASDCLASRSACQFCIAANSADAISPPVDCDLFDNSVIDGTCP